MRPCTTMLLKERRAQEDKSTRAEASDPSGAVVPGTSLRPSRGSVAKTKAYWHDAFVELSAMTQMHGVP